MSGTPNELGAHPSHAGFSPIRACWVCGTTSLKRIHEAIFDFTDFTDQDPALARYTGSKVWLRRCESCGFAQPEELPRLDGFFDRIYDQQWSEEWITAEFTSRYKDQIFKAILDELEQRHQPGQRRLLDIGAHAGRFIWMASRRGWQPEGIELNPRTARFAARQTGLVIHQRDVRGVRANGDLFDAVTMTDVLEHIPEPKATVLEIASLVRPGGCIAIKVPNGPVQLLKERMRARLRLRYRASVADNLVHVNHFTPSSLALLLRECGFNEVAIVPAPPERVDSVRGLARFTKLGVRIIRGTVYRVTQMLPAAVQAKSALHIQAYARRV